MHSSADGHPRDPGRTRHDVLWATGLPAPYRLPVWSRIAASVDLGVWLLADNAVGRRWSPPVGAPYDCHTLRTLPFRFGEETFYTLAGRSRLRGTTAGALVLPAFSHPASWQLLHWALRRRIATLAFNESTLQSHQHRGRAAQALRRRFFTSADHVLTVSPGSSAAVRATGVPVERITQCDNAVDVHEIHLAAERARAQDGRRFDYLYCGQLIERKQPGLVLEALASLPDRGTTLLLAGDGPLRAALAEQVTALGLEDRVDLVGYLDPTDVWSAMGRCRTLVMPSLVEVHGLVATEALAAGLHVVLSVEAGVSATVEGMPGVWIASPDVEATAAAMAASAAAWAGPVSDPPILGHGPIEMAAQILGAVEIARADAARRPEPA